MQDSWEVVVIGSGPAGLAAAAASAASAAASAVNKGARVCIIEREERPGGILKQCIHDGFGLIRYNARLTGPEYAWRELQQVKRLGIPVFLSTYIDSVQREPEGFRMSGVSPEGTFLLQAKSIVLATGCRERTARQIFLHGSRPAGVYTAGLAQYFINIQGYLPTNKCVILGSGDIGLIMARRLVLEGAEVEGVYEIMPQPSGLPRNISQCLDDYHIPLHPSTTVSKVHGRDRLEGVTTVQVDPQLQPVAGTEENIECDSLVLSVGLIPENEIAMELGAEIDPVTQGPVVDAAMMSTVPGLFSCGNALQVSDLVDYVSESGEIAGRAAALFAGGTAEEIPVRIKSPIAYTVPQRMRSQSRGQQQRLSISAVMRKNLTCLACPRGCNVVITLGSEGEIMEMEGCSCVRGEAWIRTELLHPMRTLTTTVRTAFGDFPRLPVRTERDIELQAFPVVMQAVDSIVVTRRMLPGEVIAPCVYEDGAGQVALLSTGYML